MFDVLHKNLNAIDKIELAVASTTSPSQITPQKDVTDCEVDSDFYWVEIDDMRVCKKVPKCDTENHFYLVKINSILHCRAVEISFEMWISQSGLVLLSSYVTQILTHHMKLFCSQSEVFFNVL